METNERMERARAYADGLRTSLHNAADRARDLATKIEDDGLDGATLRASTLRVFAEELLMLAAQVKVSR